MLNRSPSSVSREFRRNSYADGTYAAHHADKLYKNQRKNCGRKPILISGACREYVLAKMMLRWSPEQIAGRAKLDKELFSVSFPTIYRAVNTGVLPPQLKKIMRFKWKHKKCKTEDKRGILQYANVLPELKTVLASVIGKATQFLESAKPAVLELMLNVNPDTLLLLGLTTDRIMHLTKQQLKHFQLFQTS